MSLVSRRIISGDQDDGNCHNCQTPRLGRVRHLSATLSDLPVAIVNQLVAPTIQRTLNRVRKDGKPAAS